MIELDLVLNYVKVNLENSFEQTIPMLQTKANGFWSYCTVEEFKRLVAFWSILRLPQLMDAPYKITLRVL